MSVSERFTAAGEGMCQYPAGSKMQRREPVVDAAHPNAIIRGLRGAGVAAVIFGLLLGANRSGVSQDTAPGDTAETAEADPSAPVNVPGQVDVMPQNSDEEIEGRLQRILRATTWYEDAVVEVEDGVVFLSGTTDSETHRQWAEQTAMRTSDVVAVVNHIRVRSKPVWDITPAWQSLRALATDFLVTLPLLIVAAIVVLIFIALARLAARIARRTYYTDSSGKLLNQIVASCVGALVVLIGVYIALRISGLTRLAATLLGGTGLLGLAIGFAFRDIAENFLASVLLSLHHPFRVGDLIEVDGTTGFVKRLTTRGTVLATFEGHQVQIPNSTIYKGRITNFTATPLARLEFRVGIGFKDSIVAAQQTIMEVLRAHVAVCHDPEPLVLVDSLGSATVNLRCLYWFDQREHSPLKVNSAVIRLVKQALVKAGISMPDEAREIVFPEMVPVRMIAEETLPVRQTDVFPKHVPLGEGVPSQPSESTENATTEPDASSGEGDLRSEADDVNRVTTGGIESGETNLIGD